MATKRQTTFAKMDRERAVKEKRARKQEKKDAAKDARRAGEDGTTVEPTGEDLAQEPELEPS